MTCRNIVWNRTEWAEVSFHWGFNSTLDGVERSASSSIRFITDTESAIPTEKGPRASLEFSSGEKTFACTGKQTKIFQSSGH